MRPPPPPLGSLPVDDAAATAPLTDLREDAAGALRVRTEAFDSVSLPADVLFRPASDTLDEAARARVDEAAATLRSLPGGTTVTVVGHTDDQGGDDANLTLSRRRAEGVADILRRQLRDRDITVVAEGRGKTQPLVPNLGDDGRPLPANRAENRRVEIQVPRPVAALVHAGPAEPPPPDAPAVAPRPGEEAAVEVEIDPRTGDRIRLAVEAVHREPDLRAVRVDLLQTYVGGRLPTRTTRDADLALAAPNRTTGNGARDLRLVDGRGGRAVPLGDDRGDCLCADQQPQPVVRDQAERLSIWFADPDDVPAVDLLVPRAGLLRNLVVRNP